MRRRTLLRAGAAAAIDPSEYGSVEGSGGLSIELE